MKEKNGILQGEERLWDVALRGIGIVLPDEYVLRFCALLKKAGDVGLKDIRLSDMTDIEYDARQDAEQRVKKLEETTDKTE